MKNIAFPKPDELPKISRVDGNHRLHGADEEIERQSLINEDLSDPDTNDDEVGFPIVPFCMLMGLTAIQEGSLLRTSMMSTKEWKPRILTP